MPEQLKKNKSDRSSSSTFTFRIKKTIKASIFSMAKSLGVSPGQFVKNAIYFYIQHLIDKVQRSKDDSEKGNG